MNDRALFRVALAAALCLTSACGNVDSRPDGSVSGAGGSGGGPALGGASGLGGGAGGPGGAPGFGGGTGGRGGATGVGGVEGGPGGATGSGGGTGGAGGTTGSGGGAGGSAGATGSGGSGGAAGTGETGTGGKAGGAGSGAAGGGGAAGTGGCVASSSCPAPSNPCQRATCTAGVCGVASDAAGTICSTDGAKVCDAAASCNPLTFRVLRVGDGSAPLNGTSAPVFIEERRTDGTLAGTVSLPTAAAGLQQPFTLAGTATSEGGLALSSSGHYLTAAGYATPPGTASVATTTSADVYRLVARVDLAGTVDTSTSFSTAESGANPRSAISADGSGIWLSGSADVWYGLYGAATQSGTIVLQTPANVRWLGIFGGQLYGSSGSGAYTNVFSIGPGLPVTVGQTATSLPGLPTSGASPYGFVLFDLDPGVPGNDRLYLADDVAGLQKWTFDGTVWSQSGSFNLTSPVGFRGLAGYAANGVVTLMASTAETGSDRLVVFVDSAAITSTNVVATAPANTAFRGVALSPHF